MFSLDSPLIPGRDRGLWFGAQDSFIHVSLLGKRINGKSAHAISARRASWKQTRKNLRTHRKVSVHLRRTEGLLGFSAQFAMQRANSTISIDFAKLLVAKFPHKSLPENYTSLRTDFSAFLPTPRFVWDGTLLFENLAGGTNLSSMAVDPRREATLSVLKALKALVDEWSARVEAPPTLWADRVQSSPPHAFPKILRKDYENALDWLAASPLVPSHGEMKHSHILCDETGGFVAIDLDQIGFRPAWFDGIYVALGWRKRDFSQELSGVYDAALRELTPEAGPDNPARFRRELVSAWIAFALQDQQTSYLKDDSDVSRFLLNWAPILEGD